MEEDASWIEGSKRTQDTNLIWTWTILRVVQLNLKQLKTVAREGALSIWTARVWSLEPEPTVKINRAFQWKKFISCLVSRCRLSAEIFVTFDCQWKIPFGPSGQISKHQVIVGTHGGWLSFFSLLEIFGSLPQASSQKTIVGNTKNLPALFWML